MFKEQIRILFIDDNSSFILPLLRCFAGQPNVQSDVLITTGEKPKHFRHSRYLRKVYSEQVAEENFLIVVKETIGKSSADLIIPTREWISKLLYKNKTELEKIVKIQPVSDVKTIETVNDKWKLNQWLEENYFPSAKVLEFSKETEMNEVSALLSVPVLLKPSVSLGGKGIKLISSKEDLIAAFKEKEGCTEECFFQEYIDGYDIGINIFAVEGRILCHTIQKGLFQGQLTYSRGTEFVKNLKLYYLTTNIIGRLKYSGVANLDFRFDTKKEEFVLIDFNARYWSTLEGSKHMGVNFPVLVAAYSMGLKVNFPDYSTGTYYCTTAAIKTLMKNLFSEKKYPINLLHTKITSILKDPVPEIVLGWEEISARFK